MAALQHKRSSISTLQHGSALVVSLLILLVLTVIGVTSVSTSALQSKMATNTREYNTAFQAAESALRYGEAELSSTSPPAGYQAGCTSDGLCLPSTNGTPVWNSVDWTATLRTYGGGNTSLTDIPAAFQPKYIIEKLPPTCLPGCNLANPHYVQYYRITASGTGANGSAAVMVQSVYEP